jgi:pimeloyl-ACP methyl ester carboxylesterase
MSIEISRWRSADAEGRFRSVEDELIAEQWPNGIDTVDVDTSFGSTHVYRWVDRSPSGAAIVFLHGMGGTGATWAAYVGRLADRDVYALDTIGDVGRSVQRVAIADADGLARWLDETLAALGVERCHLVGTSYGGWQALNLAARRPARVAALTLIDSGGLAPFRLGRFMLWGIPLLLGWLAPGPVRRRLARTRPLLEDPRVMRMALHGQRNHAFRLPKPEPLTDAQLAAIDVPTTVVVAGRSAPFDPRIAAERARIIPGAAVDVVEGAGHEVSWTHVERCLTYLTSSTSR